MRISLPQLLRLRASLSVVGLLLLSGLSARGQYMLSSDSPAEAGTSAALVPEPGESYGVQRVYPSPQGNCCAASPHRSGRFFHRPNPCLPGSQGLFPGQMTPPGQPDALFSQPPPPQPGDTSGTTDGRTPAGPADGGQASAGTGDSDFVMGQGGGGVQGPAGGAANTALSLNGAGEGGYLDSALPLTQYRLRVETADDDNRPDRADYFYPKCGCFRTLAALGKPNGDPNAPGPGSAIADHVNYTILYNYLEWAPSQRFSAWIDVPYRWVDIYFTGGATPMFTNGWSDIMFGFKGAIIYRPNTLLTFQWRTYTPTGLANQGLGRNNWNLEPGFLFYQRLTKRTYFQGQIQDFIPVASADNFAGNVLNYGFGLSYLLYNRPYFRILPVYEMLGWNVLSGKETTPTGFKDAAGDTIVNAKVGVRFGFGQMFLPNYFVNRADLYLGYGRALTGDVWYKNTARAEFRLRF